MNTPQQLITDAFTAWQGGDSQAVFKLMADDLQWTVIGNTKISGTYTSRSSFLAMVNSKLMTRLSGPLQPTVQRIFADGDTVVAQFTSVAPTHEGAPYQQTYCWVMQVAQGRIQSGTAYLDTALIDRVVG